MVIGTDSYHAKKTILDFAERGMNEDLKERVVKSLVEKYMAELEEQITQAVRSEVEKYGDAMIRDVSDFIDSTQKYLVHFEYTEKK